MDDPETRLLWLLLLVMNLRISTRLRMVKMRGLVNPLIRWLHAKIPDLVLSIPKFDTRKESNFHEDLKIISRRKKLKPGQLKVGDRSYMIESTANVKQSFNYAITNNRRLKGFIVRENYPTLSDLYHKELRCFSKIEKLEMIASILDNIEQLQIAGEAHGNISLNNWLVADNNPIALKLTPPAAKVNFLKNVLPN